ncbi:MAG: DNA repair protein RadC [Bacteroidales bacterium]|nr:DNA repair protein RadC [Bacteroidales bacterium]MDD4669798.1 DNA repair protein RadC [Bacteroidales bacterium]
MTNNIKTWQIEERPREKLIAKGKESLTNAELIAIILRSGNKEKTAVDLARELLELSDNKLMALSQFSVEKIKETQGIGDTKAITILAAFELGMRLCSEIPESIPLIHSSADAVQIISPYLRTLQHEECWVMFLNKANKLIGKEKISQGGISSTVIDIKIIVKKAVEKLASSIILVHNHPSGSPYPGEQDRKQTAALKEAASYFDISLLDHIIIAGNKFYSFSDENC